MIYTIENKLLKVSVDTSGAQLHSVYSKASKTEYIWQGDPAYWSGRAYNLFPFIGRRYKNLYSYDGELYTSRPHGLARYYLFRIESRTATKLTMVFSDDDESLLEFPFRFEFRVEFTLEDAALKVRYIVTNLDDKTLICSFGGHPGINIPFGNGNFEDYYLEFSEKTNVQRQLLSISDRFMADKAVPYPLQDGVKLPLQHNLFDHDAIILSNTSREVYVKCDKEEKYVSLRYDDYKYIGFWHPGKTNAPFVCLEPWSALPATDGIIETLETKEDMTHVPAKESAEKSYVLEIHE